MTNKLPKNISSANAPMTRSALIALGVLLLSVSTLMFEIVLIRLSSVVLFSDLAFIGITVALLGTSVGGIIVHLCKDYFRLEKVRERLAQYSLYSGISQVLFLFIILNLNLSSRGVPEMLIMLIFGSLPFVYSSICLTLVFQAYSKLFHFYYFIDLAAAAGGVLLAVVLLNTFSAPVDILIGSGVCMFASSCFGARDRRYLTACVISLTIIVVLARVNSQYPFLDIVYTKKGIEKNIIFSKWNSFSRVTASTENVTRKMASFPSGDLSVTASPEQIGIEIDSDAYTPVMSWDGDINSVSVLKSDLSALGFYLAKPAARVFIIGSGGGRDILAALSFGHLVKAIEINPIIANDLMRGILAKFSGNLYNRPDVEVIVAEGRSYIHKDQGQYDIITIPLVDTWASTAAGNLVLVEGNLYTVEAFEDYLRHLNSGGILSVSRWSKESPRLLSLYFDAARHMGIKNPTQNIAVVSNVGTSLDNYLFKAEPFTATEIAAIKQFSSANRFEVQYVPGEAKPTDFYQSVLLGEAEASSGKHVYTIPSVSDDNPFFFFTSRFTEVFNPKSSKLDGGLGPALIVVSFLIFISIYLPLAITRKSGGRTSSLPLAPISYFILLGAAFIFVEMAIVQKFVVYLEKPIYSYSVVLMTLLFFSGIGSFLSGKIFSPTIRSFRTAAGLVFFTIMAGYFSITPLIHYTIGLGLVAKLVLTVLSVIPMALCMGTMFPLGIKWLDASGLDHLIPSCWSVNGASSVLASIIAMYLAIFFGFNTVLLTAAMLYALALGAAYLSLSLYPAAVTVNEVKV